VNIFAAVVVVAALLALKRGREAMAGSLVALAIVLKPYFVLLVPWLVARRRPRSILAVTAGIAAALALPAAVYGVAGAAALHRDWWRTVRDTTAPNVLNPDNVSWMAMYTRWFGDASGAWPTTLLVLTIAGAIGVLAWVWAHRGALEFPEGLEGALLLVLMPFLSPQGWDYVLLVATPAVVYIAAYDNRVPSRLRWMTIAALALVGLTIYDVIGRTAYHAFMNASGITWCFVVVIAALVTLRLRRVA
jgi:hypothetical protein